ncbi:protein bric-a-brac 1-like [Vespa velutina]|uniref:protein bric-a-brac 1-like n=2 Tax=Vespa TaxID=7443 RepID=UPI001F0208D5|nr:protein bric-a-brac 1-like [Vespa crabro]XP_046830518.1 protein bric-a-brac 1-like [Vespa crabro]XP_046830519.1 protein bric-a-brac 1-like [Vespa crabro]XP_047361805.1 protein bric-a-brac 1-like [Vespa velutina]XP_047361806.1 protein bric-a-brac 1-like [Vespa velutina]
MTQQSGAGSPQQFCLRWNNYQTNLTNVFDQLLQSESFVDVTLACDGHSVKAHKMVLSACSPYFQALFFDNPCQHPIVIMKDIKWPELKAAVEFMYKGEINVSQEQIGPLLKVAESLKIRGLADVNSEQELTSRPSLVEEATNAAALHRKKRRRISGERSPNGNSPDHTGSAGSTTGGTGSMIDDQEPSGPTSMVIPEVHALIPNSSTPRSLGSPSTPSVSVTPQINLQELPVSLPLPPPPPPPPQGQPSSHPMPAHHVPGHVTSGPHPSVNHLAATHGQQLVAQQQQQQHLQQVQVNQPGDDLEIKPGIAEMIREEERAKLLESSHAWLGASTSSIADSYQYQLQSMWQKCWNTNQSLVHNLRFRERGPLKSWRPETMAEAIFSVLKEGLSLSQAARKYDIPYPTFVLYANRVHNMLGPSADGGADLRPKGRGRPQRILLGVWPDEHIRGVIRAVVFRDGHSPHIVKEEPASMYPTLANYAACNGPEGAVSPGAAAAAAVAAVAQGLRHQMCSMVAAAHSQHDMMATNLSTSLSTSLTSNLQAAMQASQHHNNNVSGIGSNNGAGMIGCGGGNNTGNSPLNLGLASPGSGGPPESPMESPLASPLGPLMDPGHIPGSVEVGIGVSGMTYKPARSFVSPRPENLFQEDIADLVKSPHSLKDKDKIPVKLEPLTDSRCE